MNALFYGEFLASMSSGIPIAIAMCIGSLAYIWVSGAIPPSTRPMSRSADIDRF